MFDAIGFDAGQAAHAKDAGEDQTGAALFGQTHGGAGDGLVEEGVVEEGEDDFGEKVRPL